MFSDTPIFQFRGPFGVPVQIGQSFIMLLLFLVVLTGGQDIFWAFTFFMMLVASIFLHELGHAWGYLIQGLPVKRIMLYGGGGYCQGGRSGTPKEEELVVVMGPIVNLSLWAICGLISTSVTPQNEITYTVLSYIGYFANLNLILAIMNLIPVHPLDGGKLFHLVLMRFFSYDASTKISGGLGLILSILWFPAALIFYMTYGWILFFFPSIMMHYNMLRNQRV